MIIIKIKIPLITTIIKEMKSKRIIIMKTIKNLLGN